MAQAKKCRLVETDDGQHYERREWSWGFGVDTFDIHLKWGYEVEFGGHKSDSFKMALLAT
jgi:hypothetical protein